MIPEKKPKDTKMRTVSEIEKELRELEKPWLIKTNQGTYGFEEARDAIGTGDPKFADRNIYQHPDGRIETTGPDSESAPGRMRSLKGISISQRKEKIRQLKAELRDARAAHERKILEDGKQALCEQFAEWAGVSAEKVKIVSGFAGAKTVWVEIEGMNNGQPMKFDAR